MIACMLKKSFDVITWCSLFQLVGNIVIISAMSKKYLNVYNVFALLTYLFHFGQSIIVTLPFSDIYFDRSVVAKTSIESVIEAEIFVMMCFFAIGLGYIYMCGKKKELYCNEEGFDTDELCRLQFIAIVLVIITFIPMIYIDIQKIVALKNADYNATYLVYQSGIGKYIGMIGQFGKPALVLLIFSYQKRKRLATYMMIACIAYLLFAMLSGDRGTNLVYLLAILFVYFLYVRMVRLRVVVLCGVMGYLLLSVISTLSLFRSVDFSVENFIEMYRRRSGDGIIYSCLREFGGSMITLVHTMEYIPSYEPFNFGLTYIHGLFYIMPVLPDAITEMTMKSVSFIHAFPETATDYISLGGSYLGELFFNFGWSSPVFATFIGCLIGKMDIMLRDKAKPRYAATVAVVLPMFILWVRDFYVGMVFKAFWLSVLILYVKWRRKWKKH